MIIICILELILIIFLLYRSSNIQARVDKLESKVHRIVNDLSYPLSSAQDADFKELKEGETEDGSSTLQGL